MIIRKPCEIDTERHTERRRSCEQIHSNAQNEGGQVNIQIYSDTQTVGHGKTVTESGVMLPQAKDYWRPQIWKRQGRLSPGAFRGSMTLLTP